MLSSNSVREVCKEDDFVILLTWISASLAVKAIFEALNIVETFRRDNAALTSEGSSFTKTLSPTTPKSSPSLENATINPTPQHLYDGMNP